MGMLVKDLQIMINFKINYVAYYRGKSPYLFQLPILINQCYDNINKEHLYDEELNIKSMTKYDTDSICCCATLI